MSRKRRNLPSFTEVEIKDIADSGKSVAKIDGMVVFVSKVVPGDVVDIQVVKKKKSYMEALPTHFHQYSPDRIDAFCEYFGTCGGCKWQYLSYEKQLQYKQKQVTDALSRIGKMALPECQPIIPSKNTTFYRNKLEFTFTNTRWLTKEDIENASQFDRRGLGFHIPGKFDRVLDIEKCYLQAEPSNKIRNAMRDLAKQEDWEFFDLVQMTGFLRNIMIRTSNTGDVMVVLIVGREEMDKIEMTSQYLQEQCPEITSLGYIVNAKMNSSFADLEAHHLFGEPFITEKMEDLQFRVGAKSFYQTNSDQAYELYKVAREQAQLTGNEVVYDLYTGTGTIAQFVAKKAKKVIGVEYVDTAIEDAKENAKLNGIDNTAFYAGDMRKILTDDFVKKNGAPDVIITDPPRAGMHPDVIKMLLKINAQKIVYVSCNPATQARDLADLSEQYEVKIIQPVDMFPHTHHVENVVLLVRKES